MGKVSNHRVLPLPNSHSWLVNEGYVQLLTSPVRWAPTIVINGVITVTTTPMNGPKIKWVSLGLQVISPHLENSHCCNFPSTLPPETSHFRCLKLWYFPIFSRAVIVRASYNSPQFRAALLTTSVRCSYGAYTSPKVPVPYVPLAKSVA